MRFLLALSDYCFTQIMPPRNAYKVFYAIKEALY